MPKWRVERETPSSYVVKNDDVTAGVVYKTGNNWRAVSFLDNNRTLDFNTLQEAESWVKFTDDTSRQQSTAMATKWGVDSLYCHESEKNCAQCPLTTHYRFNPDRCNVPLAVRDLLVHNVPKTKVFQELREVAIKKSSYQYPVQGCIVFTTRSGSLHSLYNMIMYGSHKQKMKRQDRFKHQW
jgi:hypothetical protein